ncbi:MAG TPA: hypothetical protein VJ735_05955 [Actinomycetes bacterium]|nr:hypothetical protein [Actinomycetes bacterium]
MLTTAQLGVSDAVAIVICLTLAGVIVRGRARLCWSFVAYLVALLLGNRATTWWPREFYTHDFWLLKTSVYTAITVLVAAEVAALTFVRAPRARRRALLAIGAIALAAAAATALEVEYLPVAWLLVPRGETAALWALLVVVALASWHRIPMARYHKALIVSRTLCLTFDVVLLGTLAGKAHSDHAYATWSAYFTALDPLVFAATACVWAWAAWRPLEVQTGVRTQLQPWAARC